MKPTIMTRYMPMPFSLIQQYLKGRADELLAKSRHTQLAPGEKEELRKLLAHK